MPDSRPFRVTYSRAAARLTTARLDISPCLMILVIVAHLLTCGIQVQSPEEQVALLKAAIDKNNLPIKHIWIDVEAGGDQCPLQWNRGTSGNIDFVKSLLKAVTDAGFTTGIYSGMGSWESAFKSADVVVDTSQPLW